MVYNVMKTINQGKPTPVMPPALQPAHA